MKDKIIQGLYILVIKLIPFIFGILLGFVNIPLWIGFLIAIPIFCVEDILLHKYCKFYNQKRSQF